MKLNEIYSNLSKFHEKLSNFINFHNFVLSLLQFSKFFGKILVSFKLRKFQTYNVKVMAKDKKSISQLSTKYDTDEALNSKKVTHPRTCTKIHFTLVINFVP
jgi:hypothetical protein